VGFGLGCGSTGTGSEHPEANAIVSAMRKYAEICKNLFIWAQGRFRPTKLAKKRKNEQFL
jgi:hypothetical protein